MKKAERLKAEATERLEQQRNELLAQWAEKNGVRLNRLNEGQRWVIFAGMQVSVKWARFAALRRLLGYLLMHCGMGFSSTVVSAILGVTDRSVRYTQALKTEELLQSVCTPDQGHRQPKLGPEQAGVIAKYLVEHPKAQVAEILAFIKTRFEITMDRLTLRRYIQRYGLGCLREETVTDTPLFGVIPNTEAPFC